MNGRLGRIVLAPLSDLVAVALLRVGAALRGAWLARRGERSDQGAVDAAQHGAEPRARTEGLVLEVVVTAAALSLAPLLAGSLLRTLTRRATRRA